MRRLVIVAVGGQGNLLASRVLGDAAIDLDVPVQVSEIHGIAQRGGIVETAMVFGEAASAALSDGAADVLLGFEPLETLRAIDRCAPDALVVTNTRRLPPFAVSVGLERYPAPARIEEVLRARAGRLIVVDAVGLALEAGSPRALNMVLLGCLVGAGALPLTEQAVARAIIARTDDSHRTSNLAGFERGLAAVG